LEDTREDTPEDTLEDTLENTFGGHSGGHLGGHFKMSSGSVLVSSKVCPLRVSSFFLQCVLQVVLQGVLQVSSRMDTLSILFIYRKLYSLPQSVGTQLRSRGDL
jgi:hypothetical protein